MKARRRSDHGETAAAGRRDPGSPEDLHGGIIWRNWSRFFAEYLIDVSSDRKYNKTQDGTLCGVEGKSAGDGFTPDSGRIHVILAKVFRLLSREASAAMERFTFRANFVLFALPIVPWKALEDEYSSTNGCLQMA